MLPTFLVKQWSMVMKAIELVLYKLKDGIGETAFSEISTTTNNWLAQQPGFITRRHGIKDDGERVDYVEWESMEDAKAAGEKFMNAPELRPFIEATDMSSVTMRHFELVA